MINLCQLLPEWRRRFSMKVTNNVFRTHAHRVTYVCTYSEIVWNKPLSLDRLLRFNRKNYFIWKACVEWLKYLKQKILSKYSYICQIHYVYLLYISTVTAHNVQKNCSGHIGSRDVGLSDIELFRFLKMGTMLQIRYIFMHPIPKNRRILPRACSACEAKFYPFKKS